MLRYVELFSQKKPTELLQKAKEPHDEQEKQHKRKANEFLNQRINFLEIGRHTDLSPLIVSDNTPVAKIHFLFTMLSPYQIFVVEHGYIAGVITINDFLRKVK